MADICAFIQNSIVILNKIWGSVGACFAHLFLTFLSAYLVTFFEVLPMW